MPVSLAARQTRYSEGSQWRPRWTCFTAATSRARSLQQVQSLSQVVFASHRVPGAKFPTYQSRLQSAEPMNGQELLLQAGAQVGSVQRRRVFVLHLQWAFCAFRPEIGYLMTCHLLLLLFASMNTMTPQKRMKSTGCLLDSGISKVPCVLSLVRAPALQISHVHLILDSLMVFSSHFALPCITRRMKADSTKEHDAPLAPLAASTCMPRPQLFAQPSKPLQ